MGKFDTYKIYAYFVVFYILVVLFMPVNPLLIDQYDLSDLSYRVLLLTVSAFPAFLTWFAAFYGFEQLRRYAQTIKKSPEGRDFKKLSVGVAWMAFTLPVISTLSIWLRAIANAHHGFQDASIILSNYVLAVIAVIMFAVIGNAARRLSDRVKTRPKLAYIQVGVLLYLILILFYSFFVFSHSTSLSSSSVYPLSIDAMMTTMLLPFAFAWFTGLLAALDILAYASKVSGILYRRALQYMAAGLLVVIIATVLLQYMDSAVSYRTHLVLNATLVVHYLLYFCLASGFGLVGYGAKRLQQIEKV